ncbi:MAG: pyridoxal phosphate-dependent aminotransferase, partial [Alphaproteobacteria bacterium]|nr:pyridoxal phosphate-dependent aminotransferase [Alphaproteobacteria bacterium]
KLQKEGKEIVGLTAGELAFPLEAHVALAMVSRIMAASSSDPRTQQLLQYTPVTGTPEVKAAIRNKFKVENGLDYEDNEIIATAGAKEALAEVLRALVRYGQKVIVPTPAWVSYQEMTKLAGGTPVGVETDPQTFKLTPEKLRETLAANPDAKCLILNSPCNPTGAVYSREELQALANVLKDYPKVVVISDDIYEHIRYETTGKDGEKTPPAPYATMAQIPGMKQRTVTINGGSKVYAMTGLRIGYAAGPQKVIKAMDKVQGHSSGNPCVLSQAALTAALTGPQDFLKKWMAVLTENRDLVVGKLNDMGLACPTPDGAFYAYPSCKSLFGKITDKGKVLTCANDVAEYFLENKVLVVPGDDFGNTDRFRVSFAADYQTLTTGMAYIQAACLKLNDPKPGFQTDGKSDSFENEGLVKASARETCGTPQELPAKPSPKVLKGFSAPSAD